MTWTPFPSFATGRRWDARAAHAAHASTSPLITEDTNLGNAARDHRSDDLRERHGQFLPDTNRELIARIPHVERGNLLLLSQDVLPIQLNTLGVPLLLELFTARVARRATEMETLEA